MGCIFSSVGGIRGMRRWEQQGWSNLSFLTGWKESAQIPSSSIVSKLKCLWSFCFFSNLIHQKSGTLSFRRRTWNNWLHVNKCELWNHSVNPGPADSYSLTAQALPATVSINSDPQHIPWPFNIAGSCGAISWPTPNNYTLLCLHLS